MDVLVLGFGIFVFQSHLNKSEASAVRNGLLSWRFFIGLNLRFSSSPMWQFAAAFLPQAYEHFNAFAHA